MLLNRYFAAVIYERRFLTRIDYLKSASKIFYLLYLYLLLKMRIYEDQQLDGLYKLPNGAGG